MKSYTLSRALDFWNLSKESKTVDTNFQKFLKAALKSYVLPQIDPSVGKLKTKEFNDYCNKLTIDKLQDALAIFDESADIALKENAISKGTKSNYRSALARFLKWMEQQVWWKELFGQTLPEIAPPRSSSPKKEKQITNSRLKYALLESELTESLKKELEIFKNFSISGGSGITRRRRRQHGESNRSGAPKINKVSERTFKNHRHQICLFLGWCYRTQNYSLADVKLELLTDIDLIEDFCNWSVEIRKNSHCLTVEIVKTAIAIAKWLNHEKSFRRNWSDIPIILDLRDIQGEYTEEYKKESQRLKETKWKHKKMTHEEARKVVQHLYQYCAPKHSYSPEKEGNNTKKISKRYLRNTSAIVWAWQVYIIVKILVYCPVRQQEIRTLELGKTLFKKTDDQGIEYYEVIMDLHKNYSKTGKSRNYKLPSILTKDIDLWLNKWRPIVGNALTDTESWLNFWGKSTEQIERTKETVKLAKQGIVDGRVKNSLEKYIERKEDDLRHVQNQINSRETVKKNFESHNLLFFHMSHSGIENFGKSTTVGSLRSFTVNAIAKATKDLFGEERVLWTNPHAFRHIGEKHIRSIKGNTKDFGVLIGHSEEMGNEYAEQITSDYEITRHVADNWWDEKRGSD